jgi:peptidyl-prolyl cis-trans isomerase SurA
MTTRLTQIIPALLAALAAILAPGVAAAQGGNPFAPAVYVNDRVITNHEIAQYRRFFELLRQPGDLDQVVLDRLIDERLQLEAAQRAGVTVSPEEIEAGMAEFAGRANLTTEEFLRAIGQGGVDPETFRSFVEAGIAWRNLIRTRFGPRAQPSDAEIDRALAQLDREGGVQVLLSEIVMRVTSDADRRAALQVLGRLSGRAMTEEEFAAEARARSAAPSRGAGGRLNWVPLSTLPPEVAGVVLGLAPGTVSQPVVSQDRVAVFLLRGISETGAADAQALAIDWAEYAVADAAEAARIAARIDTCDDLYGVAKGQPEERLRRETLPAAQVPADVARAIEVLDDNEVLTTFSRGGRPILLMLCGRTFAITDGVGPSREQVRNQLIGQRLAAYAEGYLAELRADATIRRP